MAEQIQLAQEHLFAVLDYTSPDDFSVRMKNYRCYKPNAKFPGANHISLLNATHGWRVGNRMETAKAAIKCDVMFAVLRACWPVFNESCLILNIHSES